MLTRPHSPLEVKSVVFYMNGEGSPSLDDFGGCFYQAFWDIVGRDVYKSVLQFFDQGWFLPNLNSNMVVLIPKVVGVDNIGHFRPIALANFQFKIITMVLADRLSSITPNLISPQQFGFVKGRNIAECIGTTFEAINLLGKKVFGGNWL